jgi:hypothetical protein
MFDLQNYEEKECKNLTPVKFLVAVVCGIIINLLAAYLYKLFMRILSKNKKINNALNN